MTIESIVDANEKAQPDDEGCEYCSCGLYPHTVEDGDENNPALDEYDNGDMILWCCNEECENYHKPVGGFSA